MRSKHTGAEEFVYCNPGFDFAASHLCFFIFLPTFWTEVKPPQQHSMVLAGGGDKPLHSRSLILPAVGWLLVFISFPSVTQSDNTVVASVCIHNTKYFVKIRLLFNNVEGTI